MTHGAPVATRWRLRRSELTLDRPRVLGIVNVTPDSFSDGGRYLAPDAAAERAELLVAEGADVLDVGGESTRPQGATSVPAGEELRRVLPAIEAIRARLPHVPLSIDTVKADVAGAALDAGVEIVNDVSGFRLDPRMAELCASRDAAVILMHSRGGVSDMATFAHATYDDVVSDVIEELAGQRDLALRVGIARERIALDPGIGFAKRGAHSLALLGSLPRLTALGHPVVVGVSRKRFIGELTGVREPAQRVHGTTGANVAALMRGARLFRVHDVRAARQALDVAWAVLQADGSAVEVGA